MLSYREIKPCQRCAVVCGCEGQFIRRELQVTVVHLNSIAAIAERRLPDVEVLFDCQTYWPRPTESKETP